MNPKIPNADEINEIIDRQLSAMRSPAYFTTHDIKPAPKNDRPKKSKYIKGRCTNRNRNRK